MFSFGDNAWGQLGLGHNNPVTKPTRVKGRFDLDCYCSLLSGYVL